MKLCFFLAVAIGSAALALPSSSYFVPNSGQWEGDFAFRCDVGNGSYFVTSSGLTMAVFEKDEG